MSTCTFFGHRDTPNEIVPCIRRTLIDLIENENADLFYVGNNGNFDSLVLHQLEDLSKIYAIKYYITLSYMPEKTQEQYLSNKITILPEGIETVPKRFAISYRNKWMVEQSDIVVTYVTHSTGGAYKFMKLAKRKGKTVINLHIIE